jgi:hypothetical protein
MFSGCSLLSSLPDFSNGILTPLNNNKEKQNRIPIKKYNENKFIEEIKIEQINKKSKTF